MDDFFGYHRNASSSGSKIASSEFAIISIGGAQALVQRVSVNYGQEIRTVFAVGDTNVYWLPGHAFGTLDVTTLVGKEGFFAGWRGTKCGSISPLSVRAGRGICWSTSDSTINFDGGMMEKISADINQGQLEMQQSVSIRVASLAV
jgi:hypothetical protein